jgi:hypothetical protein
VPKIAKEDITCYKVLEICNPEWEAESGRKRKSKKIVLKSIYYPNFKWSIDKRYKSRLVIEPRYMIGYYNMFNYYVTKAFHSYQTLESAKSYCQTIFVDSYVIVRCIIPKGAKYCEGMNSLDENDGYASNQIIMKEIVDFKELYPDFDFDKYPYKQGQLLLVSDPLFHDGFILRVTNVIPLDCDTVRLNVGSTHYDTDINGIPVLNTVRIQIYNNKETK